MPNWKEGDRVRVVTRPTTEEDRAKNRYFDHMAGLTGTVQSTYSLEEIAIRIDDGYKIVSSAFTIHLKTNRFGHMTQFIAVKRERIYAANI